MTRLLDMQTQLHALATNIRDTVQQYDAQKQEAMRLIETQQALIERLTLELDAIAEKQAVSVDRPCGMPCTMRVICAL